VATPIPVNRTRFSAGEVVAATGGRAVGVDPALALAGVTTDSRAVVRGNLFVALRGETHDGHAFVPAAGEAGAVSLVATGSGIDGPRIEVADTLAALAALARFHVDRVFAAEGARPVLAIGGAAGKTTTKTLAAAAVRALYGQVLVTEGNLNNRIGVPMTLLRLDRRHRALVVECGTSVRGEIPALGALVRPDVGVVLNVDLEHSAGLGTLEQIADEEGALLSAAGRVAITSAAEPLLVDRLARSGAPRRRTFGTAAEADYRLLERSPEVDGRSRLRLGAPGGEVDVRTSLLGPAAASNVVAALAGALELLDHAPTPSELARVARALGKVEAVPGRMRPVPLPGGALALDDTYNSNPRSVTAALAAAIEIVAARGAGARLLVALGDMLELGDFSPAAHDEMVRAADASGATRLILIGPESTAAAVRVGPSTPTACYPDSTAAAAAEGRLELGARDVVLVKGSRGIRTERLLDALSGSTSVLR
jgi:UDP-N-acetylmuramoyl-tripeptide--D-alanyl-D-alanine ligase